VPRRRSTALALALALALAAGACSGSGSGSGSGSATGGTASSRPRAASSGTPGETHDGPPSGAPATFTVRSSVEQLVVTRAEPGTGLRVFAADGGVAGEGRADRFGQLVVRFLEPGDGYVVVAGDGPTLESSGPVTVWSQDDLPPRSLYESQSIGPGYQYLTTRDGTKLAVNVTLPGPPEDGPYPTVVEYSGYSPADPGAPQPSTLIAGVLGYATVGVNVRGTGCSGGAFLFQEPVQSTDGYDVVETIAAQPWVAHGEVGMVGLSYPGITQLFVAQTRPPHLAAIAPLSVIADTYRSTLRPGGILNDGFALGWAEERQREAEPGGQAWAQRRIDEGDRVCARNQRMRSQNADMLALVEDHPFYDDLLARVAPFEFVERIDVPVFLAGAWQDEQTGGHFPSMLDRFTSAPVTRFTLVNGGHTEALIPAIFQRWSEFLDIYVKRAVPDVPDAAAVVLGAIGASVFGTELELPPDRFGGSDSYEDARAAYEAEDPVRVLFENGAGAEPGAPVPRFERTFSAWPIPEVEPATWYLEPGGRLAPAAGASAGTEHYAYDTSLAHSVTLPAGESPWVALPAWHWEPPPPGAALAYETAPLDETLVMAGHGRVDLTLSSTATDVDVQVVLTEVRPDGIEVYVQAGWLRASHRALDPARTTELRPWHTHTEADSLPLTVGEPAGLAVELFPFAHVARAGSRLRVIVSAPGGVRPSWTFDVLDPPGDVRNTLHVGGGLSSVTLPVLAEPGSGVPTDPPPCPSLRGQPCRPYAPILPAGDRSTEGGAS
jgi:predicted acyl esterase